MTSSPGSKRAPRFPRETRPAAGTPFGELTHARHSKYQDTLFHLEPDVKETPGGLRDLHFINWLARLRPEQRSETALEGAAAFLGSLRCFLHYQAGRDRNILNFEAQESITEQTFTSVKPRRSGCANIFATLASFRRRPCARWTRRSVDGNSLLTSFRDWRSRLSNSEFSVVRERVFLRSPGSARERSGNRFPSAGVRRPPRHPGGRRNGTPAGVGPGVVRALVRHAASPLENA